MRSFLVTTMMVNKGRLSLVRFETVDLAQEVNFFPGGEWLYFNVYANQNCIDLLIVDLSNIVYGIDPNIRYFFTRYNDEIRGEHLRFRIKVSDNLYNKFLKLFNNYFHKSAYVRSVNIDTYQREIVRYGWPTILEVENLFHIDSKVLQLLLSEQILSSDIERIAFCIYGFNHYLDCFGLDDDQKLKFVVNAKNDFFREHNLQGEGKKSLNRLYQKYIKGQFDISSFTAYAKIENLFRQRQLICEKIISNYDLGEYLNGFIWSVLHMFSNKIFSKQYRVYEMVAYDYFEKQIKEKIIKKYKGK